MKSYRHYKTYAGLLLLANIFGLVLSHYTGADEVTLDRRIRALDFKLVRYRAIARNIVRYRVETDRLKLRLDQAINAMNFKFPKELNLKTTVTNKTQAEGYARITLQVEGADRASLTATLRYLEEPPKLFRLVDLGCVQNSWRMTIERYAFTQQPKPDLLTLPEIRFPIFNGTKLQQVEEKIAELKQLEKLVGRMGQFPSFKEKYETILDLRSAEKLPPEQRHISIRPGPSCSSM